MVNISFIVQLKEKTHDFIRDCAIATNKTKGEVIDDVVNDYISSHIHLKQPSNDKPHEYISQDTLWPPTNTKTDISKIIPTRKFKYKVHVQAIPEKTTTLQENMEKALNSINDNSFMELHDIKTTTKYILVIYKEYERNV